MIFTDLGGKNNHDLWTKFGYSGHSATKKVKLGRTFHNQRDMVSLVMEFLQR